MPKNERETRARPLIRKQDIKLGDAIDFEVAKDFSDELPFMIHCKRCGMPFHKEWRQQRLLYLHQKMYAGECSAPSQLSVDLRILLGESLGAVLDKAPNADVNVYELLRDRVASVMVDYNHSGPAIPVNVMDPNRPRACA